jgi:hypothetical protein
VDVHRAFDQLGYELIEEQGTMRHYQLRSHPEASLFLDFIESITTADLTEILESHGVEIVEPFFAMYESL